MLRRVFLATVALLAGGCLASSGDRAKYYLRCTTLCEDLWCGKRHVGLLNETTDYADAKRHHNDTTPLDPTKPYTDSTYAELKLLRWGCREDCRYDCMQDTQKRRDTYVVVLALPLPPTHAPLSS